ncbi:hypothetical protein MNBD_ALPHA04-1211, partial [hydrothermal vent metagenome]
AGGSYSADPDLVGKLREQILAAMDIEMTTPQANMESVELMRIGYDEIDANPDGISLSGPMIEAGKLAGQIDREHLSNINSKAAKFGREQLAETHGSIAALYWITTPANTRTDQIEAGRQYVRANLQANKIGLSMHPMSQSLQEYKEVAPQYKAVHKLLGAQKSERVQMLARIGHGPDIGPSPRWPLKSRLL